MKDNIVLPVMFALIIGVCFLSALLLPDSDNESLALTLKPRSAAKSPMENHVFAGEISIENAVKPDTGNDLPENGIRMKFITNADWDFAPKSEIRELVSRKSSGIRYCYGFLEEGEEPGVKEIKVRFLVNTGGDVDQCFVVSQTFDNDESGKCACSIILGWDFPKFSEKPSWISLSMIFNPEGRQGAHVCRQRPLLALQN